jgi:hypothetical protein
VGNWCPQDLGKLFTRWSATLGITVKEIEFISQQQTARKQIDIKGILTKYIYGLIIVF